MLQAKELCLAVRFQQVSLTLEAGQLVMLMGPNGAGKSSLLLAMAGLEPPDSGTLSLYGKDIAGYDLAALARLRGYLEQTNSLAFPITLRESLAFSLLDERLTAVLPPELDAVLELQPLMDRPLNTLSGGEQQRAAIARSLLPHWSRLAQGTGLLLLDEPLQGLDLRHQHLLCELLLRFAQQGNLVTASIHDVNMAAQYASHVGLMKLGKLQHFGDVQTVLQAERLSALFDCQIEQINSAQSTTFISSAVARR